MSNDALFEAIRTNDVSRVRDILDADPALASARGADGLSAVTLASYYRRSTIVHELLARRVTLDIWEAAIVGDNGRVRALLADDPSLANRIAPDGFSPLGLAAYFGRLAAAEALLDAGADVNAAAANPSRVRPLHSAVANSDAAMALAMAELLLRRGADVNAAQQDGWTPLHQAADNDHADLVRLLLSHGADPSARAGKGQTALDMATAKGATAAAAILRDGEPGHQP